MLKPCCLEDGGGYEHLVFEHSWGGREADVGKPVPGVETSFCLLSPKHLFRFTKLHDVNRVPLFIFLFIYSRPSAPVGITITTK